MINVADNFSYQGAKPLDARLKYDTLANMKAVADATMYEGCLGYCEATGKTYQWKSTNTVDADTGKWREFESGGGGGGTTYTAGDGIVIENDEISLDTPASGDMLEIMSPLPSNPSTIDLDDLSDVEVTNPKNNDTIAYNSSTNKWENKPYGGGSSVTVLTQTLSAGSTTVTFTGLPASGDNLIDFFTSNGINYSNISISGTTVVLTYPVQQSAVTVYCRIEGV